MALDESLDKISGSYLLNNMKMAMILLFNTSEPLILCNGSSIATFKFFFLHQNSGFLMPQQKLKSL